MNITKSSSIYDRMHRWSNLLAKRITLTTALFIVGSSLSFADEYQSTSSEKSLAETNIAQNKQRTIKGVVLDHNGESLPGATIAVMGGNTGTITDVNGAFMLKVNTETSQIKISFVGMKSQIVTLGDKKDFKIILQSDAIGLQEVVAIGYGTQKKANLTGSVASVGSEALEDRPVANTTDALQGKVAGLTISSTNFGGQPGKAKSIRIRGFSSLTKGSGNPYVLVDGVDMSMNDVDPDDIEDITVLKDAASSAIYGARAAYGVILITTKKGKGKVRVRYSNNFSFAKAVHLPAVVDSPVFARYFNDASRNDGSGDVFTPEMLGRIDQYYKDPTSITNMKPWPNDPTQWGTFQNANANTNWYDVHFKEWTPSQKHNVNLSGSTEKTSYYLSLGYYDQSGILNYGDESYKRYTLNTKLDSKVNDWLKVKSNINYTKNSTDFPSYDMFLFLHNLSRIWPNNPLRDENGFYTNPSRIENLTNGGRAEREYNRLAVSVGVDLEPIKNWVTSVKYNTKINSDHGSKESQKVYTYSVQGEKRPVIPQSGYRTDSRTSVISTPQIFSTYKFSLKDHNFKIMAGAEQVLSTYESKWLNKKDLVTSVVPSVSTAVGDLTGDDSKGHWSTQSVFSRFNYNYKEKYLMEINWRADGSSKFREEKRWGSFPSISMGWDMAKESFLSSLNFNQLKLRASYGSLGNQSVPNYQYIELMKVKTELPWIINGERPIYTEAPNIISSDLTWETVTMKTIGLDFALLNNRLSGSVEAYERLTSDMFGPANTLPSTLGTGVPKENNAELRTRGWELALTWKDQIGNFKYSITGTLADYTGEIIKYKNDKKLLNSSYEGKKLGEIWGYESNGLFQSEQEIKDAPDQSKISKKGWFPGDVRYDDLNGDGVINWGKNTVDDSGDKHIIGNATPRYQYGVTFEAKWKGIDFSMFWQGIGKRDIWLNGPGFFGASGGMWQSVAYAEHMDYWTPENTDAYYARPYFRNGGKNQQVSSRYLQDASYIRLKNMQIGYTFPKHVLEKVSIQRLRFYVSGENLMTFSNMSDIFDPEAFKGKRGAAKIYPLQMVFSAGVNISF
ncbi:TonB-dependent receptor [Halosquirtibacter xylanolyticus]|uniref:SusC/RagA family TonB-linked outer membrane protein n=1 Tax=Halosquirtibacter xylanolyticus TaxID=3374599 RepID=UPI003747B4FE|nr:TonB-dependent receptor [Prolixibacteraceae bacterium]